MSPLYVVNKLNLGELPPLHVSLDGQSFMTYPQGILEDVLVKVDNFIFPVDSIV